MNADPIRDKVYVDEFAAAMRELLATPIGDPKLSTRLSRCRALLMAWDVETSDEPRIAA